MAEKNPLEEKIKKLEERARQIQDENAQTAPSSADETFNAFLLPPLPEVNQKKAVEYASFPEKYNNLEKRTGSWLKRGIVGVIGLAIFGLLAYAYVSSRPINRFHSRLSNIKENIAHQKYDGLTEKVRALATDVGKEKPTVPTKKILEELQSLTYKKSIKIEARTERRLVKEGHYEQVWVEPQYETKTVDPVGNAIGSVLQWLPFNWSVSHSLPVKEKTVKVKDGYYENKWVAPVYQDITFPAHYQKIEINPYNDTQKVIEDNIPIK
ncbi:hypothetical protein HYU07_05040 [Candidatus Woesearchaeota archaeon]|nr:hypothetical protein [Candidatus Woesearchaeota archaeon]